MLWPRDLKVCPKMECRDESVFRPRDRFFTRQWLQKFSNDGSKMLALRNLLTQHRRAKGHSRLSDDEVMDEIVNLLVSGRLHLHGNPVAAAAVSASATSDAEDEPLVPFPLSERKPPPSGASSHELAADTDPPTFPSDTDLAAQAATLVAAANIGAAGCSLCQKR